MPTFLGGSDRDCAIGHPEVEDSAWVLVRAGACHRQELRVPKTECLATRHAVINFRSRWFGARFAVYCRQGRQGSESGERVCVKEVELYPSHVYPQRLTVPLGGELCTLELEFDNSDSWMTALEIVCDAAVEPI